MKKNSLSYIGLALLIFGIYLILAEYGLIFKLELSWPLILIIVGAAMLTAFFNTKPKKDYLLWGNILLFLGIGFTFLENVAKFTSDDYDIFTLLCFIGLALICSGLLSKKHRYYISYGVPVTATGLFLLYYLRGTNLDMFSEKEGVVLLGVALILIGIKLVLDLWFGKNRIEMDETNDKT